MSDFASLKKSRGTSSLDAVKAKADALGNKGYEKDERYWYPQTGKDGNGSAVIRFLPPPSGEEDFFVRLWSHSFKHEKTGKWYIENSLTTIGQQDAIADYNSKLWNTEIKANRDIVSKQKRKLSYISNILVIKDPANPQNEGKQFLYKYGMKIFEKIKSCWTEQPDDEDHKVFNPFDLWAGANFKIKIKQVAGQRNYDESVFLAPKALSDDDAELEKIYKGLYSLKAEIAADKFKSAEVLHKNLIRTLGFDPIEASPSGKARKPTDAEYAEAPSAPMKTVKDEFESDDTPPWAPEGEEGDDLEHFKKLLAES